MTKQKILNDHIKIGKVLKPPFSALGSFKDAQYINKVLPEIIWISFLNKKLGYNNGAELSLQFVEVVKKVSNTNDLPYNISWFANLNNDTANAIKLELKRQDIFNIMVFILEPFLDIYIECPLNKIFKKENYINGNLSQVKDILNNLLDKTSIESTFSLANVVYIHFVSGNLTVAPNSSLADFPKIIEYPKSEISKQIASSIRATTNVLLNDPLMNFDNDWNKYFWNRGYELEPCFI